MCKMMTTGLVGLAPRRKRAGYTQAAFAEALGITRSLLAAWEARDGLWPSARWLPAMADLLGCSIDDLYEVPEEDGPPRASAPTNSLQQAEG